MISSACSDLGIEGVVPAEYAVRVRKRSLGSRLTENDRVAQNLRVHPLHESANDRSYATLE